MKIIIQAIHREAGPASYVDPHTLEFTPSPVPVNHVASYCLDIDDSENLEKLKKALSIAAQGWNATL